MTGETERSPSDLPVIEATDPGTAPERSAAGGRGLGPGRGAGIAAAAIALLVVAIALGGLSLEPQPSASPAPTATLAGDASPRPCLAPTAGRNANAVLSADGVAGGALGVLEAGAGPWRIAVPEYAFAVPAAARLLLTGVLDTCFTHVRADYLPTYGDPAGAPVALADVAFGLPTGSAPLGNLPEGDWLVRVAIQFDSPGARGGGRIPTTAYFRVHSGGAPLASGPPTATPEPTPEPTAVVGPEVPCGTLQPTGATAVYMIVGGGSTVAGAPAIGSSAAVVRATQLERILIVIDGEACAVAWTVTVDSQQSGHLIVDAHAGPPFDPAVAAQNRWNLILDPGTSLVSVQLRFANGVRIDRYWQVDVAAFTTPALYLVGPDGTRIEASQRCGGNVTFVSGGSVGVDCGPPTYDLGPDILRVAPYTVIHLGVPGWGVTWWSAQCATTGTDLLDEGSWGCSLGGGLSDSTGPLPDPPAFVLPPGDAIVRVGIEGVDDAGNRFSQPYYAHVIAK